VQNYNNQFSFILNPKSQHWAGLLFLLWWFTMPFQSKLLGVSLGPLTIYPNLILSLILAPSVLLSFRKIHKCSLLLLLFFGGWFLYGFLFVVFSGWSSAAFFDVRNLLLQLLFGIVLVGMYGLLGKDKFMTQTKKGLKAMLVVFLIVGLVEFLTGIHFAGDKTQELIHLPVGNNFYAPMFIFDNQNTYLTYLIGTNLLLIVVDPIWRTNKLLLIICWLLIYLFAVYADSNFAKWIVYLNIFFIGFQYVFEFYSKKNVWIFLLLGSMIFFTFFQNKLFLGPLLENSADYRINALTMLSKDSSGYHIIPAREKLTKKEQKEVILYMDSVHKNNPEKSVNVRKQMILLGIQMLKEKPVSGFGPGGYFTESVKRNNEFHMGTQRSAHNFPLEIISQYGLIGWFYFALFGFVCISMIRKTGSIISKENALFYIVLISLSLLWLMPSSFLLLEIHRLILPLFVLVLVSRKTELNNG
jgi:hypothetical protein